MSSVARPWGVPLPSHRSKLWYRPSRTPGPRPSRSASRAPTSQIAPRMACSPCFPRRRARARYRTRSAPVPLPVWNSKAKASRGLPKSARSAAGREINSSPPEVGLLVGRRGAPQVAQERRVVHVGDVRRHALLRRGPHDGRGGDEAGSDHLLRLRSHPQVGATNMAARRSASRIRSLSMPLLASGRDAACQPAFLGGQTSE